MDTITIPRKLAQRDDLVIIPRKEYEALLELREVREFKPTAIELREVREFKPTAIQKKALLGAEKNLSKSKTLSYHELVKKLGFTY